MMTTTMTTTKPLTPAKKSEPENTATAIESGLTDFTAAAWQFQDITRTRIICLISHFGQVCISDISQILPDVPQQKLHRHLSYLKRDGMLSSYRHHTAVFYSFREVSKEFRYMLTYASGIAQVRSDLRAYQSRLQKGLLLASTLQKPVGHGHN